MQQEFPSPIYYVEKGCSQIEFHFHKLKISIRNPENHSRHFKKLKVCRRKNGISQKMWSTGQLNDLPKKSRILNYIKR